MNAGEKMNSARRDEPRHANAQQVRCPATRRVIAITVRDLVFRHLDEIKADRPRRHPKCTDPEDQVELSAV